MILSAEGDPTGSGMSMEGEEPKGSSMLRCNITLLVRELLWVPGITS
jgi:hypothetical protein